MKDKTTFGVDRPGFRFHMTVDEKTGNGSISISYQFFGVPGNTENWNALISEKINELVAKLEQV